MDLMVPSWLMVKQEVERPTLSLVRGLLWTIFIVREELRRSTLKAVLFLDASITFLTTLRKTQIRLNSELQYLS
jgi:hypothetical protein